MKKTIKIIDLLVNLSNKEKVPKSVKYVDVIFRYSDFHKDYVLYEDENIIDSNTYFVADIVNFNNLNYELEIIEEDKKIEKVVLYSEDDDDGDNNFYITDM